MDAKKIDFRQGVAVNDLANGAILRGVVGAEDAILIRRGDDFFAIGAQCSHYHGELADGLIVDDTIRCPLHHACFSLRTGTALRAPAFDAVSCWRTERVADQVFAREKLKQQNASTLAATGSASAPAAAPASIVIVGGGAAALAAADMLRRENYPGPVIMLSADDSAPYDRPNLSKDFLSGNAPADWMPLRSSDWYQGQGIDLRLNSRVAQIDPHAKQVTLADGRQISFGALLLATGADPVHLDIPTTGDMPRLYLRSFSDSRAIVAAAAAAKRALIVGSSFIGLEVAASLRQRGVEVHVVSPDTVPLQRVMGAEIGSFVQSLHEARGVMFHLGTSVARIEDRQAILQNGSVVSADLVVLGVGVRPNLQLAQQAGLALERGISVDAFLQTSLPGIYAAGDVARWPDPHSGERIRVEHWVVAQQQGQTAARNMLGARQRFDAVPFFWSQHFDVTINYSGHAENWNAIEVNGSLQSRDCAVTFRRDDRTLGVATIGRDLENLQAERSQELAAPR
jgi:NADPH-dependent 2,4-dienoyl-CoA reductase/sulfur reductase-like enzyme/nitrite reductase/ring-hydroxylating ferredoxin subunit